MKKHTLTILLSVICILFFTDCKKKKNKELTPVDLADSYTYNNETQSSRDISLAALTILDLDAMAGHLFESAFNPAFFTPAPNQSDPASAISIVNDVGSKQIVIAFNKVNCRDGKLRNGSVFFDYQASPPNANSYRDFGFTTAVIPMNYNVNGWLVQLFNPLNAGTIKNSVSSSAFDPSVTNLTWEFSGKFKLLHPSDSSKNIIWDGQIIKTLANTSNPAVFNPGKTQAIDWNLANVSYKGVITGVTGSTVPFTYSIDNANPLARTFTCNVAGTSGATDFHPFIGGTATFKISTFHPRSINYGPAAACDNKGTVSFKDETHEVSFE